VDFLHYITESNEHGLPEECDERLRRLHESIQEIKTSTSVEVEYMKMEERLANLLMKLSKQNRQEDSIKALEDLEYRKKLYEEFGV
jgi:hypothetical protein